MSKLKANPNMITYWANLTKCAMCKHKEDEAHLLPVAKPERDKLQPNVSVKWAFHYSDTHGLPRNTLPRIIHNSVYDIENTMANVYGGDE